MERTPDNQQPTQSELDLTQMEPITPKKVVKAEPSFLDKAKGLFAKKETEEAPRFYERKEPTFGQSATFVPPTNEINTTAENTQTEEVTSESVLSSSPKTTESQTTVLPVMDSAPTGAEKNESLNAEPVVPPVVADKPASVKSKLSRPENWAIMQKLPEKHRRLFVAITAGVLVLLALLWLKPSSETVDEIQANQSNSMPIEFQSLDPNQANQATTMVDNSQAAVPVENVQTNSTVPVNAENTVAKNAPNNTAAVQPTQTNNSVSSTVTEANNVKSAEQLRAEKLAEKQRRDAELARLEKARAEKAKADKLKEEQLAKAKAEKAKAEQQAKAAMEKAKASTGAPVVEAKPAGTNAKASASVTEATKAPSAGSSKTLTIPKGVSLMQVFRDNNLNIGDVNAMSKAGGAENALSSFKAGDKVQVSVNSQGRVSTMRLSNGATFTRQADGSYKYSK